MPSRLTRHIRPTPALVAVHVDHAGGNAQASLFVAATQIARHLAAKDLPAADRDRLSRRALELPWTRPATVVLVSTPRLLHPVEALVSRGPQNIREERTPDVHAPTLGLSSFVLSPDDADTLEIVTRRPSCPLPWPSPFASRFCERIETCPKQLWLPRTSMQPPTGSVAASF